MPGTVTFFVFFATILYKKCLFVDFIDKIV